MRVNKLEITVDYDDIDRKDFVQNFAAPMTTSSVSWSELFDWRSLALSWIIYLTFCVHPPFITAMYRSIDRRTESWTPYSGKRQPQYRLLRFFNATRVSGVRLSSRAAPSRHFRAIALVNRNVSDTGQNSNWLPSNITKGDESVSSLVGHMMRTWHFWCRHMRMTCGKEDTCWDAVFVTYTIWA